MQVVIQIHLVTAPFKESSSYTEDTFLLIHFFPRDPPVRQSVLNQNLGRDFFLRIHHVRRSIVLPLLLIFN